METTKILAQGLIGATGTPLTCTPGTGKAWVESRILVCNLTDPDIGSDIKVTMHLRKGGAARGLINKVVNSLLIDKGNTFELDFGVTLGEDDILEIYVDEGGDANNINFIFMGSEVT